MSYCGISHNISIFFVIVILNRCHLRIKLEWMGSCFLGKSEESGLEMERAVREDAVEIVEMTHRTQNVT